MARTIQIRNVPEELHRELRLRATAAGMSLSDYCLERLAGVGTKPTVAEVLKRARERPGADISTETIVQLIREHRGE